MPMHLTLFTMCHRAGNADGSVPDAGADDSPPPKKKAPGVTRIGAPAPRLSSLARSAPQPASADKPAAAQGPTAAAPADSSIEQSPWPSEQRSAADKLAALVASADATRPASPAGYASARSAVAPPPPAKPILAAAAGAETAAQSGAGSTRGDKAYNTAVLAGAQTDEAVARNIADAVRLECVCVFVGGARGLPSADVDVS